MLYSEPVNPGGHAAWGALVKLDGKVIWMDSGYCGRGPGMSNNVAEYSGFISIMKYVGRMGPGRLLVRGDSKLVVMQMADKWKVRGGLYVPFYMEARALVTKEAQRRVVGFEWIPRDKNDECDKLSKGVLIGRNVKFRIQPTEA